MRSANVEVSIINIYRIIEEEVNTWRNVMLDFKGC